MQMASSVGRLSGGVIAMSLWQKPISELSFQDIDQFCSAKLAESTRLDYWK
jgi:hypothetical protein